MPKNFPETLHRMLSSRRSTERKLAAYLLSEPEKSAVMSAEELAEASGVSTASVSRMLRSAGMLCFAELRRELSELTGDLPATLCADAIALVPDAENTLIVTDSLAMGAITDSYTPGEAAVQALQAGCDVLLMPDGLADAYDAVLAAVQNGTLSEDRLDLSVNKILRMKAQFCA